MLWHLCLTPRVHMPPTQFWCNTVVVNFHLYGELLTAGTAKKTVSVSHVTWSDQNCPQTLPRPVPVRSTMLSDKVQTWGTCLQGSVSWPGGRGITWDLCVILFFLFLGICIFTALIIWNLLEMITTLRTDQQLTQTGYNQTNASLVNKSLNV